MADVFDLELHEHDDDNLIESDDDDAIEIDPVSWCVWFPLKKRIEFIDNQTIHCSISKNSNSNMWWNVNVLKHLFGFIFIDL